MNPASIIAALCLPADSRVDQRVPKKLVVENGAPTAADKRQINEGIEELYWIAALKPATIGVPLFRDDTREYLEIAVLSLTLRDGAKAQRLTELIHRAIPYPVFLIQSLPGNSLMLSLAHLRWSQGQAGQTVFDGPLVAAHLLLNEASPHPQVSSASTQSFLQSLAITNLPREHLHALYQGWIERFEAYAASRITSAFSLCESPAAYDARRTALEDHDRLMSEIAILRSKAGKESQLNRRVELNLQLKQLESRLTEVGNHL